jgi:ParB family transcriptional regulator, chromosome partitioning protein
MAKKKAVRRRRKAQPESIGLTPAEAGAVQDDAVTELADRITDDGGNVVGAYRDPFGGKPLVLAVLPIDTVEPTPYQRDPSDPHVKRLMHVVETIGSFLDPVIVVRREKGYLTPNGNHRLQALRRLGARAITALVVPDEDVAFKILALNTEKAHNVREKSLETIRMLRALADEGRKVNESDLAFEFEEPSFLTLGAGYERRPRLSGGAYQSMLRRIDEFLDDPVRQAVKERERRGGRVLELDDAVAAIVEKLKGRGLTSPYLKPFVVARVNPIRFSKSTSFNFDEVLDRAMAATEKFKVDRVKQEDVARTGGAPPEDY